MSIAEDESSEEWNEGLLHETYLKKQASVIWFRFLFV